MKEEADREVAGRALALLLSGRVQGVGFRYFVRRLGRELGLTGRVRNLWDGRVEIEVAGDPARLERFKERVALGPPGARVTRIEERELRPVPAWEGFEIDH
jgi:acylphosphatase